MERIDTRKNAVMLVIEKKTNWYRGKGVQKLNTLGEGRQ